MTAEEEGSTRRNGRFAPDVLTAIVIPTYNEVENLPAMCAAVLELEVPKPGIIIVDDNSPDGTGQVADGLAADSDGRMIVLHRAGKLGLGTAFVEGFSTALESGISYIVQMDCDFSHPPSLVPILLKRLATADVAVASRYCEGGGVDPNWQEHRALLSRYANVGIRAIMGIDAQDPTSGFKAYRRTALEAIDLDSLELTGFGFQAEVAYRMQGAGLHVVEQPYTFMERTAGKSKMSPEIAIEALWRLTKLRLGL